jgi:hypothetical protein
VGSGEDDSSGSSEFAYKAGDGGSRDDSGKQDIGTDRSESGHKRRLKHRTGMACVSADHETGATFPIPHALEEMAGRPAQAEGDFRGDRRAICRSTDPVRAEVAFLTHGSPSWFS